MIGRRTQWGHQAIENIFSWHFAVAAAVAISAGLVQNSDLLNFFNIKPNFTLVVLTTVSFFVVDWLSYLILVLLAGIFLRFQTGFELVNLSFVFIILALFVIGRKLPGRGIINNMFLIFLGTLALYLTADFNFLYGYPIIVLKELIYNIILGTIIFALAMRFFGRAVK